MKTTLKKQDLKLVCYASGSGSLSFTWCYNVHPYSASSMKVLKSEVERFLKLKNNIGKFRGHIMAEVYQDDWELIPMVKRIGPNTLEYVNYKGEIETYLYKTTPFENDDSGKIHYNNTDFFVDLGVNEYMKTQHISTRLALIFFLKNENTVYNKLTDTVTANQI